MKGTVLMTFLTAAWTILAIGFLWENYQFIQGMHESGFETDWGYGLAYISFFLALAVASFWALFGTKYRKTPLGILITLFVCGVLFRLLITVGGYDVPITSTSSVIDILYLVCGICSLYALTTKYT